MKNRFRERNSKFFLGISLSLLHCRLIFLNEIHYLEKVSPTTADDLDYNLSLYDDVRFFFFLKALENNEGCHSLSQLLTCRRRKNELAN